MEKDNLKRFIEDNEAEFNNEIPSENVWKGVKQNTSKRKAISLWVWAAAASVIIVSSNVFYFTQQQDTKVSIAIETTPKDPIEQEIKEMEVYYSSQINQKIIEAKKFEESEIFLEEIDFLKEEYKTLEKEMKVGANREVVLQAMIENYKVRLQLLEDLLEELKEETKNTSNETSL
jgi:hypothetical protein